MAFWQIALDDLEAALRADATFASLVTHSHGSGILVDIAQGVTPTVDPPCARLIRGPQGALSATGWRGPGGEVPSQFVAFLDLHAPDAPVRDALLSARDAWAALAAIEDRALQVVRERYPPTRPLSALLGAPFTVSMSGPVPVSEDYHPAVASRITILFNKDRS